MSLTRVTQDEIDQIARKHAMFMRGRVGGARAMLTYKNLSAIDMQGMNFTGADFTASLLTEGDMRHATFDGAVFFAANLQNAKCAGALFTRADMRGSIVSGVDFTDADLSGADLREGGIATKDRSGNINVRAQTGTDGAPPGGPEYAKAGEAIFVRTKMVRCVMRGADLSDSIIMDADLSLAQMQGASLKKAVLCRTNLSGVELGEVDLQGVLRDELCGLSFEDAPMPFEMMLEFHRRWIDSRGADGKRLDFTRYDLRDAANYGVDFADRSLLLMKARQAVFLGLHFGGAQMQASELRGNDFRLCAFNQADLRGTDFSGSNLARASFQLTMLGPLRLPEGRVMTTNFSRCNLRYGDFAGADLRQASFAGADVSFADFSGANLESADMSEAVMEGAVF